MQMAEDQNRKQHVSSMHNTYINILSTNLMLSNVYIVVYVQYKSTSYVVCVCVCVMLLSVEV